MITTTSKESLSTTFASQETFTRDSDKKFSKSFVPSQQQQSQQSQQPQPQPQPQQQQNLVLVTDILKRVPDLTFMLSEELCLP
jgi:hypothetical protein